MSRTHIQFTPAAAITFPVSSDPQLVTLPAIDAANLASAVTNLSGDLVAICPGSVPGQVFNIGGSVVTVFPGQTVISAAFGAAAKATVQCLQSTGPATVTFTRGQTADLWLFPV